ncbi:MAG: hypothetical protein ACR2QQ_04175 [Gammaproteobacteria bacterium]
MKTRLPQFLRSLLVVSILTGCGVEPVREELFEERSGLTWASINEPVVLASATPGYTVAARDYLYVGPVETNRLGTREYYLWMGAASTVDRELRGNSLPESETLLIIADGAPVTLALEQWNPGFDDEPYESPVPTTQNWGARVSTHQIQRIARATSVEIQLVSETGESTPYELWDGSWQNWESFPNPSTGLRTQASR